jgi:acetyl-CoA carboxylase carboxyltransferase component
LRCEILRWVLATARVPNEGAPALPWGRQMSWQSELDELRARERMAREMGGRDKVQRQHDGGRLTVRERIDRLIDEHSFHEIGAIAGKAEYDTDGRLSRLTPANCVMGRARIDGRPVIVLGDDFTVRGGSADATIPMKPTLAERMANELRLPIIRIIEGSGGGGSVKTIETSGRTNLPGQLGVSQIHYQFLVNNLGTVPVVALGLGSVAGLGAARLAASHYSIMTKSTSAMFVAGPPVVAGIGQTVGKQELGGWEVQCKAGAVDHAVETEDEAFQCARRFLSYLPSSIYTVPVRARRDDPVDRSDEKLFSIVPRDRRKVYRMRQIIDAVFDKDTFFEMGQMFGRPIITGLARLDGLPVAVLASDPYHYGGAWTADACAKLVRFIDMAETFHLPVVYLCDCPGFLIGLEAEKSATIRQGVRAMAAINQSSMPWCTVIVRNSFGVAGALHVPAGRLSIRYAWLSGWWGSLPLEGGIEAAYRAEIDAAPDPKAKLAEIEARLNALRSPFRTAEPFWVEEIIDPRDTRKLLCEFAALAEPLLTPGPRTFAMRP